MAVFLNEEPKALHATLIHPVSMLGAQLSSALWEDELGNTTASLLGNVPRYSALAGLKHTHRKASSATA